MRRRLVYLLFALALVVAVPIATAQEDKRCIEPPQVERSFEWEYEMSNDRTRFVEVLDQGPATTPQGYQNTTRYGFAEYDEEGQRVAWGTTMRYGANSSFPWALASQDHHERVEDESIRRIDSYDPPFQTVFRGPGESCPGDRWRYETNHSVAYGEYGQQGQDSADEIWQVQLDHEWSNMSVPAGSFEVLQITAVRENDEYAIRTFWAPEAKAPAKIEQGSWATLQAGAPETTQQLADTILDQRPTARFKVEPAHPTVGDTIVLNGTPSWDPEGAIAEYRWLVGDDIYKGPVVELNVTEEQTLDIRLFVTDEANRTSTLSTTRYVSPEEGSGVAISGREEALRGDIVTLQAHPSFEPLEIRWRQGSQIVGKGTTYQFYMNETVELSADALHKSGRVDTANHTVQLVETTDRAGGEETIRAYPPAASEELAILEPLEGQAVPPTFTVQVKARANAILDVDGRPVWQGTAEPAEAVKLDSLPPGPQTLTLAGNNATHTVNVTVTEAGFGGDRSTVDETNTASGSSDARPVPFPALGAVVGLLASLAFSRRR